MAVGVLDTRHVQWAVERGDDLVYEGKQSSDDLGEEDEAIEEGVEQARFAFAVGDAVAAAGSAREEYCAAYKGQ
jgi:hypothetical protein